MERGREGRENGHEDQEQEQEPCVKHFFCNCFQLVEVERRWEFGLIMTSLIVLLLTWAFALIMTPQDGQGGTLAVWTAWMTAFAVVLLLALLVVRRNISHKIKFKRFRESVRDPWSKVLG